MDDLDDLLDCEQDLFLPQEDEGNALSLAVAAALHVDGMLTTTSQAEM